MTKRAFLLTFFIGHLMAMDCAYLVTCTDDDGPPGYCEMLQDGCEQDFISSIAAPCALGALAAMAGGAFCCISLNRGASQVKRIIGKGIYRFAPLPPIEQSKKDP